MSNLPQFPDESAASDRQSREHQQMASQQRPPAMNTAVLMMRIGAGISAASTVLILLTLGSAKDEFEEAADASMSQSDIDAAFNLTVGLFIFLGLVSVGLWLWMAAMNGKGRKWARVVATVFGVLSVLFFVLGLVGGTQTLLSILLGAVSVAVGLAALFLMYKPESTAFYQANSAR